MILGLTTTVSEISISNKLLHNATSAKQSAQGAKVTFACSLEVLFFEGFGSGSALISHRLYTSQFSRG